MKREIKFRAWSGGSMVYTHSVTIQVDGTVMYLDASGRWEEDTTGLIKLMQFTGLKDKAGRDIYEGDRLGHFGNVVEYLNGCFCVNGDRPLYWMNKQFEVIGNIFEHPQLLNNERS